MREGTKHRKCQRLAKLNSGTMRSGLSCCPKALPLGFPKQNLQKQTAAKPFLQPEFLVGSHVGVIAPLSGSHSLLTLSPSDFCLTGENYCCSWSLVKSVGSGRGSLT